MTVARRWRWAEGNVRLAGEHFELSFGDMRHLDCPKLISVALGGRPTHLVFPVRWVLDPSTPTRDARKMLIEARRQLDFYLIEHPQQFSESGKDPWSCAIYHCGTATNLYSLGTGPTSLETRRRKIPRRNRVA